MTEPNSHSHWDSLISDLGATPPPDESLQQPAPRQPLPAQTVKPAARRRRSAPATNWDRIAGELGLTSPPRPIEPVREIVETFVAPTEPQRQVSISADSCEESPNFFDESFNFEEPFDLLESGGDGATASQAAEPMEKRPRKRRRHRPERESVDREARRPALPPGAEDRSAGLATVSKEDSIRVRAGEDAETAGIERPRDESAEPEQRRSKRRRSRRGKKHRPAVKPKVAVPTVERDGIEEGEHHQETDFQCDFNEDATTNETAYLQHNGDRPVRAGFRGIPTWEEVVGLVISKNIDARTKHPGGDPNRGRGHKRRS